MQARSNGALASCKNYEGYAVKMLTVIGRFNAICARQPEALALVSDNASHTYGQLSARVTGMATLLERNFIKALGRSPGSSDIIAISLASCLNHTHRYIRIIV